jgi:O-antigen ligase/polysaccharide polymerase Wzy-like membrane protein
MQQTCLAARRARHGKVLGIPDATTSCCAAMLQELVSVTMACAATSGVLLLAAVAPFEITTPLVRLPWQSVSNVEAAVAVALAGWAVSLIMTRRRPRLGSALVRPWALFVAAFVLAAALAPAARVNALHMAGRTAAAFLVYLLTVDSVTTRSRLMTALALCLASGLVVSVLAILEYREVGAVLSALRLFRPQVTAVGAQLRAGGPLQYPTIASMYLEVVFALGVGLLLAALDDGRRRAIVVAIGVALIVVAEAIALTFTRAGIVVMMATLAIVGFGRHRRVGFDRGAMLVAALAIVVVAAVGSSRSTRFWWLRLTSEGQEAWYSAVIEAPGELAFDVDRSTYVPIVVRNDGRLAWSSQDASPILLSYHWLTDDGSKAIAYQGVRTPFAAPVPPGRAVSVRALVRAPRQPGAYTLAWDIVQEDRLWFSTEPGARMPGTSRVVVTGTGMGDPLVATDLPKITHRPGRLALWRAAARMVVDHPLLGVGPDNYRLLYGPYAGLVGANTYTHSNNMYLEVLVGAGIVGFVSFCWLLWRAFGIFFHSGSDPGQTRVRPGSDPSIALGLAAAAAAIALHGLVDSFLSFAPTYVLFALTLGCADAHRG